MGTGTSLDLFGGMQGLFQVVGKTQVAVVVVVAVEDQEQVGTMKPLAKKKKKKQEQGHEVEQK